MALAPCNPTLAETQLWPKPDFGRNRPPLPRYPPDLSPPAPGNMKHYFTTAQCKNVAMQQNRPP